MLELFGSQLLGHYVVICLYNSSTTWLSPTKGFQCIDHVPEPAHSRTNGLNLPARKGSRRQDILHRRHTS